MESTNERDPQIEERSVRLCPSCSGENEQGARRCAHCGHRFPRVNTRLIPAYAFMIAAAFLLTGGVWFLSSSSAESGFVGRVNGAAMQKAKVERFEKPNPVSNAQASCCAPGGGCGGGKPQAALSVDIQKDAKEKALEYYEKKTQKKGAEARVTDFGCHIQVDIVEAGKVVLSLTYSQGAVEET